ncbi:MAG: response regulator [Dehalococcoidales bacterium]|nr:MAG: response regulator [Dehalococcoidales bacterium]
MAVSASRTSRQKRRRVMVVDHDPEIVRILEVNLSHANLEVISARSGAQALTKANKERPDIILLDAVLPDQESMDICRRLKESPQTSHIPVIIIGSDGKGENGGIGIGRADQYIAKPFDPHEVVKLVEACFRQIERDSNTSPLTGLPNQIQVNTEITRLLERNKTFTAIYIDIDDLKAFNKAYSFDQGDRAIELLADIVREALRLFGNPDDLAGHLGSDNFIIVTSIQKARVLCQRIIADFDSRIRTLYNQRDLERGYIEYEGRLGEIEQYPIMTISAAAITNERRIFYHPLQVSEAATELLDYLRRIPGSNYYLDRREDGIETQLSLYHKGIPHAYREEMRMLQRVLNWVTFHTEELETPISAIHESLEAVGVAPMDDTESQQRHSLDVIRENVERLNEVFREFSYLTSGEWITADAFIEEVNLRTTFDWITRQVQKLVDERGIEVDIKGVDDIGPLIIDGGSLIKGLYYLLRSEINSSAPGDRLQVSVTEMNDPFIIIEVTNPNHHIPHRDLAVLFQGQMDGMVQNRLGNDLYLSKTLVQGLGGKFSIKSDKKEGTTFMIVIPRRWQSSIERVNALLAAAETSRKEARAQLEGLRDLLSSTAAQMPSAVEENLENLGYKIQELVVLCNRSLFFADELSNRLDSEQDRLLQQEVEQLTTLEAMQIFSREIAASAQMGYLFDPESARRVAKNVSLIANEFRLSRSERQALQYAALLKDMGFVSCPEDMMEQAVAPTLEEAINLSKRFNIMWKVLSRLNFLSPALDIIWHRCERYDGTGHPFGVKGANIPLGARILVVADTFDIMTTGRSSQETVAPEIAVQKLVAESGKRFDPDVVNAFLRAWRKKEFQVVPT